jgi:hypothetical protein
MGWDAARQPSSRLSWSSDLVLAWADTPLQYQGPRRVPDALALTAPASAQFEAYKMASPWHDRCTAHIRTERTSVRLAVTPEEGPYEERR